MFLSDNFLKTFVFNPIFIKMSLFWTNFWLPFFWTNSGYDFKRKENNCCHPTNSS